MKKKLLLLASSLLALTVIGCNKNSIEPISYISNISTSNESSVTSSFSSELKELDVKFENKTFEYDGNYHSLEVENAPMNAVITFTSDNSFKDIGSYNVFVTVSCVGYKTKSLAATLTITQATFKNVTFESKTFKYDGLSHSISVSNLPSFARVTYKSKNSQTEAGIYNITAEITANYYQKLTLTATLTITKIDLTNITFTDLEVPYDTKEHTLEVKGNIPSGVTVSYSSNVAGVKNTAKDVGEYIITATLTSNNYNTLSLTAKLKIYEEEISYVYEDKTPATISKNIKYDELKNLVSKNNFSIDIKFQYVEDHPTGTEVLSTSYYNFYIDNNKATYLDKTTNDGYYDNYYYYYDDLYGYKITAPSYDNARVFTDPTSINYIPKEAYMETYIVNHSYRVFHRLGSDSDGNFVSKETEGYHTFYSDFEVKDNKFILTETVYYFHPDTDTRREVTTYEYYNFGNTKVTHPDKYKVNRNTLTLKDLDYAFYIDGVSYFYNSDKDTFNANIYLTNYLIQYLPKGTYYVLPKIFNKKIDAVNAEKPYYEKVDTTGYNYRFFFNDYYYKYQDIYSDLGSVNYNWTNVSRYFEAYGGTVEFYEDWNK